MDFSIYTVYEVDNFGIKKLVESTNNWNDILKKYPDVKEFDSNRNMYDTAAITDKLKIARVNLNELFANGPRRRQTKIDYNGDLSKLKEIEEILNQPKKCRRPELIGSDEGLDEFING